MIKMKKRIFLLTSLFFISFFVHAQESNTESKGEKIKALKIAFITEKLDLTTKEAQIFWPVYNKYDDLLHQLERVEKHKLFSRIKDSNGGIDKVSEQEAKSILEENVILDNKIFKTKVEYNNQLTKVLPYKKILKLKNAEKDFLKNLMRKYRGKKSKK